MWALAVFGGLLILLVVLLSIPVDTTVRLDTSADKKLSVRASFLFGLVKTDFSRSAGKKPSQKKKIRKTERFGFSRLSNAIDDAGSVYRNVILLAKSLYRQIRFYGVKGQFNVGLEDPAHTGMLFAVVGPVNALLNLLPGYDVTIYPSFDDRDIFSGELDGKVRVYPASLIPPFIRFGLSGSVMKLAGKYTAGKWKRRKFSRAKR